MEVAWCQELVFFFSWTACVVPGTALNCTLSGDSWEQKLASQSRPRAGIQNCGPFQHYLSPAFRQVPVSLPAALLIKQTKTQSLVRQTHSTAGAACTSCGPWNFPEEATVTGIASSFPSLPGLKGCHLPTNHILSCKFINQILQKQVGVQSSQVEL